jgi:alkylation response protein AidB-like acyl-CoA dehydrogenase
MHAYEEGVKYVKDRYMRGENDYLVNLPMMVRNLDHMKREIDIARLLVKKAAWAKEKNYDKAFIWASLAKLIAGEVSFLESHEAQLYNGSMGYTMESEIGYIATDAEVIRIYEGAREVQIKILSQYLTEKQLLLAWPIAAHPITPIESLPTAEEVMAEIESWVIKSRKPA